MWTLRLDTLPSAERAWLIGQARASSSGGVVVALDTGDGLVLTCADSWPLCVIGHQFIARYPHNRCAAILGGPLGDTLHVVTATSAEPLHVNLRHACRVVLDTAPTLAFDVRAVMDWGMVIRHAEKTLRDTHCLPAETLRVARDRDSPLPRHGHEDAVRLLRILRVAVSHLENHGFSPPPLGEVLGEAAK